MDSSRVRYSRMSMRTELCDQLRAFQQAGQFCDINIKVHGHVVPAHRAVLAASGQYFRRMFEGGFKESQQAVIDLSESVFSVDTLNTILRFVYTGELEITDEALTDLLHASTLLMMEQLVAFCAEFMLKRLTTSTCLRTWLLADVFNLKDVCEVCHAMARCRFRDAIQFEEEILEIPGSFLKKIAAMGVMDFLDISEIGVLLLQWFEKDKKDRFTWCKEAVARIEQQQLLNAFIDSSAGSRVCSVNTHEDMHNYLFALSEFKDRSPTVDTVWKVVTGKCTKSDDDGRAIYSLNMYSPPHDKWYVKDIRMPDNDDSYAFIGATKDSVVFRKKSGQLSIGQCLSDGGMLWDNARTSHDSIDVAFHVWNANVVMIRGYRYDGSTTEDITVFAYNFRTKMWAVLGKPYRVQLFKTTLNSTTSQINCYSHGNNLYIFVSSCDGQITILSLKRGSDKWILCNITNAPATHAGRRTKYTDFEVTSSGNEMTLKIEDNVMTWSPEKKDMADFYDYGGESESCWPRCALPKAWHCCSSTGFQVLRVDSHMAAPRGTTAEHRQGYFFMEVIGQYLTKCWRGIGDRSEPSSFMWLEVTPMPEESLHSFSACEIHRDILQFFKKPTFRSMTVEKEEVPLELLSIDSSE